MAGPVPAPSTVDPRVAAKRAQLADIKARGDVGAVEEQGVGEMLGNLANRSITATAEGLVTLPELLLARREHGSTGKVVTPNIYPQLGKPGGFFDLKAGREDIQRQYEEDKEQFRGANLPPAVTATLDTAAEAIGPAEGLALFKAGSRGLGKRLANAADPTAGIESAVRAEFSGLPELPPQAPPPSRLRQLFAAPAEEVADDGPRTMTLREARQQESFPPDLEPWAAQRGIGSEDFAAMPYREKLALYTDMAAEEKAAHAKSLEEGPPEPASLPELTRERWEELRAENARLRAAAPASAQDLPSSRGIPPLEPEIVAPVAAGGVFPETVSVPRPQPRGTTVTERGQRIDFDYEVRDASDLVTSHDNVLRPNPAYPAEVQPRERARAASAAQVVRIEQQLNPELLGPSPRVSDGAPFIGPDGVVESGNARSIALRRAYASGGPQGQAYREWLRETAPRLGLDPAAVDAVPNPVLVRVRRTDVDRPAFAREANESAVAGFSAGERAAADAQLLSADMLDSLRPLADGSVNLQANRDFVRAFASRIAPTEHAALFDQVGALSLDGERRIQNAILARAYGDPQAIAKLTEHADSNVRSVGAAMMREAPRFARMREGIAAGGLHPLDISADVGQALRKLSALRDEGMKVSDYLAQGSLYGSDLSIEARGLLALFDANARSGAQIGDILGRYASAVEGLGNPNQVGLFGASAIPSKIDLLREVAPPAQRGLLDAAESTFQASGAPRIEVPPQAVLPPPVRGTFEPVHETMPPVQESIPGVRETPPPVHETPRMSTKGVETVAGMQDELAGVAKDNFDEIYAARGPVVPVSQWHDTPALAAKLHLAPDDYLKMPAGRVLSPDEGALGKHYLGGMKQQARELEQRIAAGQVENVDAAQAEIATRNRDVVRMMAVLQGQGSSEAGRYMRMLQEALDPYGLAETPKERLQLALLKNYGAKNADTAAAIEAKAVQRLQRLAARETRKAGRAATAEQLSSEFSSLAAELGALTRKPRGMGGGPVPLDPELVAVIGKMASNRIRAGVVAVEEVADQVYSAVRQTVGDTITREQVKASIVEHALAKPAKLTKEEARLRSAEAAARRSIDKMEASVAAGGAKAPKAGPLSSPALDKLRVRQGELREQLAAMRAKPATDPAVRRLKTAEANVARQVKKLEEKLAGGPKLPSAKPAPAASDRLTTLRQRAADLKSQIEKDPKHSLVQRYRELLDDETVELISRLPDPSENPEALVNFLRQMERPTFREYAGAFAYQNMLSGPKSLARNVIGNTVKRWDRIIMQPISAGVEAVLAPLQGRVRERYLREVLPAVVGSYRGAPEALHKGLFVLKNGYDPERLVADLTGVKGNSKYYEAGRLPLDPFLLSQNRAVRAFGAINGWGIRGMQIGDAMARTRNFSSASHAWATRRALMEGRKGGEVATRAAELLAEQPDEMIEYAQRIAREDTFQDEVSNIAKLVGSARREETGIGWALAQTVRFLNVPDRIAAWLADYTPGLRVAGAAWKGGKLRQAWGTPEASDLLARQAVGTAVAAAAAAWAFDGKLAGAAPRDEKLRNDFYAAGKQPWSVLVGGQWVPIRDVFGGWAAPVAAAAAFHDNALTGEPVDSEEILRRAGGAALGEMRYLLDANYLSNLSDVVSAIEQEPTAAGQEVAGLAARTAAGALIPQSGLLRNAAIYRDPRVVDKQGALDEIKAGLPGLRETLPARLGSLDEELVATTGKAGGFLPVVPTESKLADPALAEEVERLRFTLSRKRTEIRKMEKQLENARTAKDAGRVRELRAALPGPRPPSSNGFFEGVRADEQRVRELRAKGRPIDGKAEVRILKRLQADLLKELQRQGEQP